MSTVASVRAGEHRYFLAAAVVSQFTLLVQGASARPRHGTLHRVASTRCGIVVSG